MAEVTVSDVSKYFGGTRVLDNVSLHFPDGEFFALLGPSGSGKTTLLRAIAGFIFAEEGSISIGGRSVERIPVEKREIGMVFQSYALFPNMTVTDNVGFGLRVRKASAQDMQRRTREALDLVQLGDLGSRKPHELSGGQRQRVALARAIITRPRVLLLDEPLSALDKALRMDMQIELKRIQREVGITTIFVTHDQEEALTLSDRLGILKDGALIQSGAPLDSYHGPESRFAATFLGEANIFEGQCDGDSLVLQDGTRLHWDSATIVDDRPASIAVRPEFVDVAEKKPSATAKVNRLKATIRQKIFAGPTVTLILDWRGRTLKAIASGIGAENLPEGGEVWLNWPHAKSIPLPD